MGTDVHESGTGSEAESTAGSGVDQAFLSLERELAVFLRRARATSGEMSREVHPDMEAAAYGLLVCLDEMVNLYKLTNTQARNANYEQILRILNDSLQGSSSYLGFIFGGTPDFLLDTRRGLYSYAALQTRLAENSYATDGLVDYSGPVLRLANLSQEAFYLLLTRLRNT